MTEKNKWIDKIRLIKHGNPVKRLKKKTKAIDIINHAIQKDRDFFDNEGLRGTLEDYSFDLNIRIIDHGFKYEVDMAPKSGAGHDFNFIVKKRSRKVDKDSLMVGEVISEPE